MRCSLVLQCFVYGDSLRPQLVAAVVPDPEVLLPWAAERGLPQELAALCRDKKVAAAVLKGMQEEGRVAQLRGFEQVRCGSGTGEEAQKQLLWFGCSCGYAPSTIGERERRNSAWLLSNSSNG